MNSIGSPTLQFLHYPSLPHAYTEEKRQILKLDGDGVTMILRALTQEIKRYVVFMSFTAKLGDFGFFNVTRILVLKERTEYLL